MIKNLQTDKFKLLEDIVIPKGTIFEDISNSTFWCGKNNLSGTTCVVDNLCGRLVLNIPDSKLFSKMFQAVRKQRYRNGDI